LQRNPRRRPLNVIPVIDLLDGQVVHAKTGDRDAYRPIVTPLSRTSDPLEVVGGLLSLLPFAELYVADLDAILRRADNQGALRRLRAAFPGLRLWIDNGAANANNVSAIVDTDLGVPVLGSESQTDVALVAANQRSDRVVLSLDFREKRFLGPAGILESPDAWPSRVIVMNLVRVGGGAGPDFERLHAIRTIAGRREIYAAGGVRDRTDLIKLRSFGCAGVLVASSLHDGRLSRVDIEGL
jgi:phosphoribosylformimino-5-aminoimidazole carboxamide ribotide isomerase